MGPTQDVATCGSISRAERVKRAAGLANPAPLEAHPYSVGRLHHVRRSPQATPGASRGLRVGLVPVRHGGR